MTITREDLNPCTVQLTIDVAPEQVKDGFDRALKTIAKGVRLPGFRPGHAPKHMVEKMVNPQELYEQAADEIVRSTFEKAVKEQALEPDQSVRPSIDLKELNRDELKAIYTAKVPLPPKIELTEYKGVEVDRPAIDVTDEEVNQQLTELRKRQGTRQVVTDRSAVDGDIAVVNIKLEGEAGEGRNFMTVIGQTFPQLDSALIGMNAEEIKSLELTFPAGFQQAEWAGKTYQTTVTLNSVSAVELPELDDEFAKALQTENVDELKVRVRESIQDAKEGMVRDMLQDQILEKLRTASNVQVSDNMWEALATQRLREIQEEQGRQGKSLEQYAVENGMTLESLIQVWNDQAKVHVERAMVVREIFAAEKLQITNDELNRELFSMSREFDIEPMKLLEILKANNTLVELQFRTISRKVTDFLINHAKVTQLEAGQSVGGSADAAAPAEKPKKATKKKAGEAEVEATPEA